MIVLSVSFWLDITGYHINTANKNTDDCTVCFFHAWHHCDITSVSQQQICLGNVTCCCTEIDAADQTFCLTVAVSPEGQPFLAQTVKHKVPNRAAQHQLIQSHLVAKAVGNVGLI